MKIVIYGAGKTGQYLLKMFYAEGHDITIIDQNPNICRRLNIKYDISVINSTGVQKKVFHPDVFEGTDLFVAVSTVDELNIISCSIAKSLGAHWTVARVRNEDYAELTTFIDIHRMGVDLIIHPEKEIIREIQNLIDFPSAIDVLELMGGKVLVVSVIIAEDSQLVGLSLQDAARRYPMEDFRIILVERELDVFIPGGKYVVQPGDKIYLLATREKIDEVFRFTSSRKEENVNIMINGSSKIAQGIAANLDKRGRHNIKIIVDDEDIANELSGKLSNTLVLFSDGVDIDILAAEGIFEMDFFLALSEDDESNMVSSLFARHLQVRKTITLIETTDFLPITKTIGLQRVVNRSIATYNAILQFIRKEKIIALNLLKGTNIDFISMTVSENCRYTRKPIITFRNKLPEQSIIGVISRNGEIRIPTGKDELLPGDEVVVFTEKSNIERIEKLFGG